MLEIQLLSFFVGSLGLQALIVSGWLRWQQGVKSEQQQEEEETLTPYESRDAYSPQEGLPPNRSPNQLSASHVVGWEFKIIRAHRDIFRDPGTFKRLCEEEAQAGWILLEKLDDRRIRFKRPTAVRDILKPESLSFDQYRSYYGQSVRWTTMLGAIAFLAAIMLPAYLGYVLVSLTLDNTRWKTILPPVDPSPVPLPSTPLPSAPAGSASPTAISTPVAPSPRPSP